MSRRSEARTADQIRASRRGRGPLQLADGYTVLELLFAIGLVATLSAIAVLPLAASVEDIRTAGAVRYLTTMMQRTRMEAVQRAANIGMQFVQTPSGYVFAGYADGNANGVRTAEIKSGVDPLVHRAETLPSQFPGVDFGVLPNLPAIDSGSAAPGSDPIKLGTSNILSFTAIGSSTTGSVYVLGRRQVQ